MPKQLLGGAANATVSSRSGIERIMGILGLTGLDFKSLAFSVLLLIHIQQLRLSFFIE